MRKVFGRWGVAAETKSGRPLAVYVPHPLRQKLWHPVCEGRVFVTCGADTDEGLFCSPGKREETIQEWIRKKSKKASD